MLCTMLIAELDGRKQELLARIAELTVEAISPEQVSQISGYLRPQKILCNRQSMTV